MTGARTEKSVVGYDLTHLFIGSEGTLGVFTKLILRLLPKPEEKTTFLLEFQSIGRAAELVSAVLAAGILPCTLEYMDKTAVSIVQDKLEGVVGDKVGALLLLELDGTVQHVQEQEQRLHQFLQEEQVQFRQAADKSEAELLWRARRSLSPASFSLRPNKISEDIVVPRSKIPHLVAYTEELAEKLNLIILTFGHAGDGNIHVNIMIDRENQQETANGLEAKERLFSFVISLGGSLSGEHGVGITKSEFIHMELDENAITLMKRLKQFFDPNNILNPGKIFKDSFG